MGLEATCRCRWPSGEGQVKALLETHELILRQDLKRRIPIAALGTVEIVEDEFRFVAGGEAITLVLGAETAGKWARKIATPPPTLAQKLGIESGSRPMVIGRSEDGVIEAAVGAHGVATPGEADLFIAIVDDPEALEAALTVLPGSLPIWIIHRKGKDAKFGETPVRASMRGRGFIDTKVSAVSDRYSATRYIRR